MKKEKIWLRIAVVLIVVGVIIDGLVWRTVGHDYAQLSTVAYETNTYEIRESFRDIRILTETADVTLYPAKDGVCKVVCYEMEKVRHIPTVQDGVLTIQTDDQRSWYEHIGINLERAEIALYLPATEYGALTVETDTGHYSTFGNADFVFDTVDISSETGNISFHANARETVRLCTTTGSIWAMDVDAKDLEVSTTTGLIQVQNAKLEGQLKTRIDTGFMSITQTRCESLTAVGDTGNLELADVQATKEMTLERTTGDIRMVSCDAPRINIETNTGDVRGNLLTPKIFEADTDTGEVDVPHSAAGGFCKITTDTGDIRMTVG